VKKEKLKEDFLDKLADRIVEEALREIRRPNLFTTSYKGKRNVK